MKFSWGDPANLRLTLKYVGLRTYTTASATLPWGTGAPLDRPKTAETANPDGAVIAYRLGIGAYPPAQTIDFTHATAVMPAGAYTAPAGGSVSAELAYSPGTQPLYSTAAPLAQQTTAVMPQGYGRKYYGDYAAPGSTEVTAAIGPNPPMAPYTYPLAVGNTITLPPDGSFKLHGEPVVSVSAEGTGLHAIGVVGLANVPVAGAGLAEMQGGAIVHGEVVIPVTASGAMAQGMRASGAVALTLTADATGTAVHAIGGPGAAQVSVTADGYGQHGYGVHSEALVQLIALGVCEHTRYEVRGHVNLTAGGLALSRSVRVCDRLTGELVSMGDSTGGAFHLHCGLTPAEYTIMVVDTDPAATDYALPVANRVVSVLARDTL